MESHFRGTAGHAAALLLVCVARHTALVVPCIASRPHHANGILISGNHLTFPRHSTLRRSFDPTQFGLQLLFLTAARTLYFILLFGAAFVVNSACTVLRYSTSFTSDKNSQPCAFEE